MELESLSSGKKICGLEIPFTISPANIQDKRKRGTAASIMTQQLSSSSQVGGPDQILSVAPSFAPNSPVSTMGNERNAVMRPSINFGLNSVGASTNRRSNWELPVFGGVISSRVGDLLDSKSTIKRMIETGPSDKVHKSSHENIKSPSSDQAYFFVSKQEGKTTAAIIDYSQNVL